MPVSASDRSRSCCTPGSRRSAASQPSPRCRGRRGPPGRRARRPPRPPLGRARPPPRTRSGPGRGHRSRGRARSRGGQFGPQRGEDRGGPRALGRLRVPVAEVAGHAVAAEEGQRVVGERPGHGDPGVGRSGSAASGWPAAPRIPRPAAGPGRVAGRVQVEDPRASNVVRGRAPAGIEQAELELLPQHPARGPVHELLRHLAVAHRADQRRP